jgi:hypothetical protein
VKSNENVDLNGSEILNMITRIILNDAHENQNEVNRKAKMDGSRNRIAVRSLYWDSDVQKLANEQV